jgi:hypothetical protein
MKAAVTSARHLPEWLLAGWNFPKDLIDHGIVVLADRAEGEDGDG